MGFLKVQLKSKQHKSNVKSQFIEGLRVHVENSVESALEVNIFRILNRFLFPEFEF